MGATPQLSWLGVLGYSGASAFPAIIICCIGPRVRTLTEHGKAFSTTDFSRMRYGRIMQLFVAIVSVFYMFIYIVAEMTSISNVYGLLTGRDVFSTTTISYTQSIAISIATFTIFYVTMAGLPASIVTDKFQAMIMAILVVLLTIAVSVYPENHVSKDEFALASNWTADGATAAVTLFIAIASAEMFNQANWQRVWAAESIPAMRKGFFLGAFLVFLLMMFFGIIAMIAYANDPEAYNMGDKFAYLAFFDLLMPLGNGWHVITLILVTALAASSIDSLQNALTCIFSNDLVRIGWNPVWITRILLVVINIPAIIMSTRRFDVIGLFLVADLVCATSVFPLLLGLQLKDWKCFTAPTELGAITGCLSGVAAVLVNGAVNGEQGLGVFNYFELQNGAICSLCGSKTLITFVITPIVSIVFTYTTSWIDVRSRGDRARQPLIPIPFDSDDTLGGGQLAGADLKDSNCGKDNFDDESSEREEDGADMQGDLAL